MDLVPGNREMKVLGNGWVILSAPGPFGRAAQSSVNGASPKAWKFQSGASRDSKFTYITGAPRSNIELLQLISRTGLSPIHRSSGPASKGGRLPLESVWPPEGGGYEVQYH